MNQSEIDQFSISVEQFIERVIEHRGRWIEANAKVENSSERYVPLDDLPFGEEVIRTEGHVSALKGIVGSIEYEITPDHFATIQDEYDEIVAEFEDCVPG